MCYPRKSVSRPWLGFPEATRAAFAFLMDLGFHEVDAEDTIVRYASDRVFFYVYHGRSSYELGIEVGLHGDDRGFSTLSLVRAASPAEAEKMRLFIAITPEEVHKGLAKLADQVKRYGPRALHGDEEFFALLKEQARAWAEAFAAEVRYDQRLPKADEAFRRRDYAKAAELYESIRVSLTPAQLKKLEYAIKHR